MGRVVAFSELEDFLAEIEPDAGLKAAILDTNVIISATYEVKPDHDDVVQVLDTLSNKQYRFFATVNTKSEFLEFHRRLIMTENLLDAVDPSSELVISTRARAAINSAKALLARAQLQGSDPVFNDRQLKEIKKAFSAGPHSGHQGWLVLCELFLQGRLEKIEKELIDRGIEYISQHDASQKHVFHRRIDWPDAIKICEKTAVGFSDAMILNALYCSHCPIIVSTDFDIGYSLLSETTNKVALMPDSVVREYKNYHFPQP